MPTFTRLALALLVLATTCCAQNLSNFYPIDDEFSNVEGIWTVKAGQPTTLRVFGANLNDNTVVTLTTSTENCNLRDVEATVVSTNAAGTEQYISVQIDEVIEALYFCFDDTLQGTDPAVTIASEPAPSGGELIPLWLNVLLILVLLCLSGLFSGLNLGLMSLDPQELAIVAESGEEHERRYAKTILPLRRRGNLLLCTILLGNVLVNSTLTILMDSIAGGVGAVLGSTAAIVIFGEITPQSICSRHGLAVGAKTIWLTKFFMVLTFVISYPISAVLDYVLGEEAGAVYQRKQLLQLLRMQDPYNDLERDEVDIITGALTFKEKTASMVMTKFGDVFMLPLNSILDFKTVSKVMESGHSRIPVYQGKRDNVVGLLHVKDLAFIDPDDRTPLESVIKYYNHSIVEVYSHTHLDKLLDIFKQGRTHMVLVVHIDTDSDTDPVKEVVGIATLEDVIEEIIQAEIIDETDRFVDNVTKTTVERETSDAKEPPKAFALEHDELHLSEQMSLAAYTFLSTVVDEFASNHLLPNVLRKLISHPACLREINRAPSDSSSDAPEDVYLYHRGQPTGVFTMVLEGRVKVTVGRDNFVFEAGPFNTIATGCLSNPNWEPDFDAVVNSDHVLLLQIPRSLYVEAVSTSRRIVMQGYGSSSPRLGATPRGLAAESALDRGSRAPSPTTTDVTVNISDVDSVAPPPMQPRASGYELGSDNRPLIDQDEAEAEERNAGTGGDDGHSSVV
ncbi:uncharacterized protein MONBRDRAFT_34223 [Monosiga brevicollis MX1]|uniref:Uncharacterized protein n=1 Tax=Monosiga brevicollis TaxID=81824 RepID=A9VAB2_MONBE|nr:uncharacterized protein MONBRDRAFT_34223 [Monosiga brevicollis MX1]EDQ85456.1 predicted protein [Monosiga brevicollis MX1]|eukprot:XP_001749647.1 hypothetical protein [Monosiga brevicollis MX1]